MPPREKATEKRIFQARFSLIRLCLIMQRNFTEGNAAFLRPRPEDELRHKAALYYKKDTLQLAIVDNPPAVE